MINRQIGLADVYIGIFSKRVGTPTPRADSGTVEELNRAIDRFRRGERVEVLIYFNQAAAIDRNSDDLHQLNKLSEYETALGARGAFVGRYSGAADFEGRVRRHLTRVVQEWQSDRQGDSPDPDIVNQVDLANVD